MPNGYARHYEVFIITPIIVRANPRNKYVESVEAAIGPVIGPQTNQPDPWVHGIYR